MWDKLKETKVYEIKVSKKRSEAEIYLKKMKLKTPVLKSL